MSTTRSCVYRRSTVACSFLPFFFFFIFTRNDAAEFCASRFVIIVYPYRAVTAGSNSFVPLGHGVAPRYRDAGEFRLDDFARGRTARMELSIRRRLCSFLLIRRCLEKQKISAKQQVTVKECRIDYLLQIEVTCSFLFFLRNYLKKKYLVILEIYHLRQTKLLLEALKIFGIFLEKIVSR